MPPYQTEEPQPHLWDGTPMAAMPYVISKGNDNEGMKMSEHTPVLLALEEVASDSGNIKHLCPVDSDGVSLLTVVEHDGVKFAAVYEDDDATRFVACWNAFDGLDTEQIESMVNVPEFFFKHTDLMAERNRLSAINAELIEALKNVMQHIGGENHHPDGEWVTEPIHIDEVKAARAAIAKAQGEQL